ncbi:trypsin-related protease [Cordyceps militaris]|uniref:Trypsin-related protease n=1 Tax=Cordyceps militaris TaxID=73501 RepID=A0A2H4SWG6_CORMI|nr:trypsin-related protease [Cordyceps militaris]
MMHQAAVTLTVALSAYSAAAATIDRRIVGGEDAKEGEFPSVVSITGTNGICGGALLDSKTVLTAAHCLLGVVSVRAGSVQHRAGGVEAKIASKAYHPEYMTNHKTPKEPFYNNDIGIIKLASAIETGGNIRYATLPEEGSDAVPGSMGVLAGWGTQKPTFTLGGDAAERMARVTLPIHDRSVCDNLDAGVQGRQTLVCAGGSGKNACRYDSGSPLMEQDTGLVVGVASWGIPDAEELMCSNAPMLYTRVSSYLGFINQHLEGGAAAAAAPPATPEQPGGGPRADEDKLCSTAAGPNKYGVPEDECRRVVAQCVFEEKQKNKVESNFDGVVRCVDAQLLA